MRAYLVCVNYSDLARITIPYNRYHFDQVVVVTDLADHASLKVALENGCEVHRTDAFYKDGALFNKFRALEEAMDHYGRDGWICIMDADILWPKKVDITLRPGNLYTPRRRMLEDLSSLRSGLVPAEENWKLFPLQPQEIEFAGYTQIFHGSDEKLGPAPWHDLTWKHAGGGDSFFQAKWPSAYKYRPTWEVLHLGPCWQNWTGRSTQMVDGTIPQRADELKKQMMEIWKSRRGKPYPLCFEEEKIVICEKSKEQA